MPIIYTWGYGNRHYEDLLAIIERYAVDAVVDVRRSPRGRNWMFNWSRLSVSLPIYEHRVELGNSRTAESGWEPIDPVAAEQALDQIAARIKAGETVLLMCCEHDPKNCHRTVVANRLSERSGASVVSLPIIGAKTPELRFE